MPCYLDEPAVRPGARFALDDPRARPRAPRATTTGASSSATSRARPSDARTRGAPRSTGTASSATPRRSTAWQRRGDCRTRRLRVLRDRLGGMSERRRAQHVRRAGRLLRLPDAAPTASSRASWTSCSSGARWSTRAASRANPAFQDGGPPRDRHARRLFFDGNSQGGILGGAAHRRGARLDPRGARRPGMNYSTLLRAASTSTPSPAMLYPRTRTSSSGR